MLALLGVLAASRPALAQPAKPICPSGQTQGSDGCAQTYRLHLSDSLEANFAFSPEYDQTLTVQPDGLISLKGAGTVVAAGATVRELEARIAAAYRGVLRAPQVSVVLKDFQKPSFYASGELGHPGRYELRSRTTLLQALSEAGGLVNERAEKSKVILFRPLDDGMYQARVINVKSLLKSKQPFEDYTVRPGDIVYVPQNTFSKIARFIPTASLGAYLAPAAF